MKSRSLPTRQLAEVASFLEISAPQFDFQITGMTSDSRSVSPGQLFLAMPGARNHGAEFAMSAAANGASAIITDNEGERIARSLGAMLPILTIKDPRSAIGPLASWFYEEPSKALFLVGITGTNGKTTTTFLLDQFWNSIGRKTGLIGTIGIKIGDTNLPATRTTPESDQLQLLLAQMLASDVTHVAMEVSSHALAQGRVSGTHFEAVGFTNLTQDHLDFHGDMENYYLAKSALFTSDFAARAHIIIDGEYGSRLFREIDIPKESLSINGAGDWRYERIEEHRTGYEIAITGPTGISITGRIKLLGRHNLENLLLAVAIASASEMTPAQISAALPQLTGAPGRLERIAPDSPITVLVDYAHTPDAVTRTLATVRQLADGQVIALLGCGGDRDQSKRSLMGAALNAGSDIPIFTSDNPRSEDPNQILSEMVSSLELNPRAEVIPDRRAAIRRAISLAKPGDVVIALGKGHESGQEISGVNYPFSDQAELLAVLKEIR